MAYQHYRLTAFLYVVLLFISAPVCYSQQNSFDKQGNLFSLVNNKVDSSLENDFVLMNARYFDFSNYSSFKIFFCNNTYKDIHLIYYIFEQKLHFVLNKTDEKGVIFE